MKDANSFERQNLGFAKTNLLLRVWKYLVRKKQFTQNFEEK